MDSAQLAIAQALKNDWSSAITTNLEILKEDPQNVDALNRLARAYTEMGKIKEAKMTAQKVLLLDSVNSIAMKCLEKCKALKTSKKGATLTSSSISHEDFLEIPGKTKIVDLIHPGDDSVLARVDSGDEVQLLTHPHRVSVVTTEGRYIGRLPDDLSARLRTLIREGNKYVVIIKSVNAKVVKVFIRGEVMSFPTEKLEYVSFTPPELVHRNEPLVMADSEALSEVTA